VIPNITRGRDFRGLLRYLAGPGRANEHRDPHLVGADDAVTAWAPTGVLSRVDARQLADELALPTRIAERAPKAGPVWHCSLSVKAEDGPLSEEQWHTVAGRFVDKLGWSESVSGRWPMPWLAIHHGLSKAGNDHIHVVVSMVREDGTYVDTHNDYARAQQACRELEAELGLTAVVGPHLGLGSTGLTPAELNRQDRTGTEPARLTLERAVRAAAVAAAGEAEFVDALRVGGVRVAPYYAAGGTTEVTGYKVALVGEDQRWFGGGRLSRDLTLPRLRLRWSEPTEAERAAAMMAWHRTGPNAAHIGPKAAADVDVDRINRQLAGMVLRLRQIEPGDMETWSHVAQDTAGVFSAWARAAQRSGEPETAGPLDAAARASRQLGQLHRWAITGRNVRRGTGMTSAALLVEQFATGGAGKVGQAIFLRQLVNTLFVLRQAAIAHRQTRIAEAIGSAVRDELNQLIAALPAIPEQLMTAYQQAPTIAQAEAALAGLGIGHALPPIALAAPPGIPPADGGRPATDTSRGDWVTRLNPTQLDR